MSADALPQPEQKGARAIRPAGGPIGLLPLLLTFLFLIVTPASGQECIEYGSKCRWISRLDTRDAIGMEIVGTSIFIADGEGGLVIADVSDPSIPTVLSTIETPDIAYDVRSTGAYAYVALGQAGIGIYDVHSPSTPRFVATIDVGEAYDLEYRSPLLFVTGRDANWNSCLTIVDVTSASRPLLLATVAMSDPRDVQLVGSYAYVTTGGNSITVVDVGDPTNPSVVTVLYCYGAVGMDARYDRLYVGRGDQGLSIFDVSNPASPVLLNTLTTEAVRVRVYDRTLYALTGGEGVIVMNLDDVSFPVPVGRMGTPGPAFDLCKREGAVFVADESEGLLGYDVTADEWPQWQARLEGPESPLFGSRDLAYGNGFVYLANERDGLRIIDLSNPSEPAWVGHFDTYWPAAGVAIAGDYCYVAESGRLEIVNVSDPTSPVLVQYLDGLRAVGIDIRWPYVFVAAGDDGFVVVDVADPIQPHVVATLPTRDYALNVRVVGHIAYMTDRRAGLALIDVRNPTAPVEVGRMDTPGSSVDVSVDGAFAYVADGDSGLCVVDCSQVTNPVLVGRIATCGFAIGVDVSDGVAYLAEGGAGVHVFDVSSPPVPSYLGSCAGAGLVEEVVVAWCGVLAANDGLTIFPLQCPEGPTPTRIYGLEAHPSGSGIEISWTVASKDFTGFQVERAVTPVSSDDAWRVVHSEREIPLEGPWRLVDDTAFPGVSYAYRIAARERDGSISYFGPVSTVTPGDAAGDLRAMPTPFRSQTVLRLPGSGPIGPIRICNIAGQVVREFHLDPNDTVRSIVWDGRDDLGRLLPSGVYLIRYTQGGRSRTARAVISR